MGAFIVLLVGLISVVVCNISMSREVANQTSLCWIAIGVLHIALLKLLEKK